MEIIIFYLLKSTERIQISRNIKIIIIEEFVLSKLLF